MEKFFIELCWDHFIPYIHLKDLKTKKDEFIEIPFEFEIEKINQKICIGTLNPYTREYISCDNFVDESEKQCNKCKYLFDFYKCIRCHGGDCYVKNKDVLKYCNTNHYVYLACFSNGKIKVGTASEVKKYNRLLEQGALFSIFIAKTPNGKIARQIEKNIIDSGISGAVTTSYKMKNIVFKDDPTIIKRNLMEKYKEIVKTIPSDINQYLIEPEFNEFNEIQERINNNMLIEPEQFSLFDDTITYEKPYEIKKDFKKISGKYLFAVGKILALENNGIVELIDTKKLEGYLFNFENMKVLNHYSYGFSLGGR